MGSGKQFPRLKVGCDFDSSFVGTGAPAIIISQNVIVVTDCTGLLRELAAISCSALNFIVRQYGAELPLWRI